MRFVTVAFMGADLGIAEVQQRLVQGRLRLLYICERGLVIGFSYSGLQLLRLALSHFGLAMSYSCMRCILGGLSCLRLTFRSV